VICAILNQIKFRCLAILGIYKYAYHIYACMGLLLCAAIFEAFAKQKKRWNTIPYCLQLAYQRLDAKNALIGITLVAYLHQG
jgi:hypothetical protein